MDDRRVGCGLAASLSLGAALVIGATGAAPAHHSFAMFDQKSPIEMEGVVKEFRYVSPHSFIVLEVKQEDGTIESWILEGVSPSALAREGWSKASIKPGDELKLTVAPLRGGAPGGAWVTQKIKFRDGRPIIEAAPTVDH
jgi:hypothetical protein